MKIAIVSDTHLGYARFEKDAFVQAERALLDASEKSDIILFAGDVFDVKIPKLETLDEAISIFRKVKVPVFAIHGNHERRTKDQVNPAKLLSSAGVLHYLHSVSTSYEYHDEKIQILGIGNVPDEYADEAVKNCMKRFVPEKGAFKILLIHQAIRELIPHGKNELSLEYLESLGFDLIVNGHIHGKEIRMGGKFIIPGSTVITQLKKEEMEQKGYFIFDTATRQSDFIPIECRLFFFEEIEVKDASPGEVLEAVRNKIEELRSRSPDALIALKINGALKEGLYSKDLRIPDYEHVFIDNRLDTKSLDAKLETIRNLRQEKLSVRELALKELEEKTKGKITSFDSSNLFAKLVEGADETLAYLEKENDKTKNDGKDDHGETSTGS